MKRLFYAAALAIAPLSTGCTTLGESPPLGQTVIDENAVTIGAKAVDAAALALSLAVKAGLQPGTPKALKLATLLDDARNFVNAAAAAREVGNAASYAEAIAKVGPAMDALQVALRPFGD